MQISGLQIVGLICSILAIVLAVIANRYWHRRVFGIDLTGSTNTQITIELTPEFAKLIERARYECRCLKARAKRLPQEKQSFELSRIQHQYVMLVDNLYRRDLLATQQALQQLELSTEAPYGKESATEELPSYI